MALLDICLFFAWIILLLPVSGIAWTEVQTWLGFVMDGIPIGGITLKPVDLLLAILTFMLALTVTRFLQRRLDDRVLSKLQIDRGVQNSITTGVGYVGVLIAILIGIGTLGLDLSNLALIAGALSVGIGFGLQNVVQNFVAGLILLVERPIKVGDWVVVGQYQGIVKRISVRATEIQTFQRAAVIVPNAELVSTAVLNWTHKDKLGRVDVSVGVEYGTDLRKVKEALIACAHAVPNTLRYPAPIVSFKDFGASSLDFVVMVYIADVDNTGTVASELRFMIAEKFEELGIGIPYAQTVTHIPQLDALRDAIAEANRLRLELDARQQATRAAEKTP
jgi:potassium-dependent mechanosensitive channel